jgi:two-component system response regulator VicR
MRKTILIVEDEKSIVDILAFNLEKEGYETVIAYDGKSALAEYEKKRPDIILLDVMLPELDGFKVCERIRVADLATPIIMLTAREEETDKVLGLEIGADDYITKPFSFRELKARIKANLRSRDAVSGELIQPTGDIEKGFVIDKVRYDVFVDGRACELTQREFELICFLSASAGKVFSREELLHEVWKYEFYGDLRAVDVAVRRLREKIEEDPSNPNHIMTKRGVGYYFVQ